MTTNSEAQLRRELLATARAIAPGGLGHGTAGNVSARCGDGFLITPSAMAYEACTAEDMVRVSMSGEHRGPHKPSSEWRFHRDIYLARADAQAIVHTHAPAATALACLHKPIPAFHYMIAVAGGDDIRCAPYAMYGTQELADHVVRALEGRYACLLANHGLITLGNSLRRAFDLSLEVEDLARIYGEALKLGAPVLLTREQMAEVLAKFAEYRKDLNG
jgi:L-fuculose-phosphate aldolase